MSDTSTDPGTTDEDIRRREQRGWYWYDWANSAFPTSVITVFLAFYLTDVARRAAEADGAVCSDNALVNCQISLFGIGFQAGSLFGYLLAAGTILQVIVLPITGAIADRSRHKRSMLAGSAMIGAVLTAMLALVDGTNWELAVVLFTLANVAYGVSVVVYYSMLPEIATADERDRVSSNGWAFGYLGGGLILAVQVVVFTLHDTFGLSTVGAVKFAFVSSGIWWAVFTLVTLRRMRRHEPAVSPDRGLGVLTGGFQQLWATVKDARRYPITLAFLAAYLVYTDGISTVAKVSGQYGDLELGFDRDVLVVVILVVQFVAFLGALVHGRAARRFGAKRTILASLLLWVVVIAAAYFVEAGAAFQFYGLAVGIGLVLGGTNALSRSVFSQLIPKGKEAEYFSVYEIGEKASSALGPLLFGAIGAATGSFRPAILSLIIFFAIGFVAVCFVPIRRGIAAAGNEVPKLV